MSNIRLLKEVKLWPRQYGIPTPHEYKILCHLASDPEARVYLEDGYEYGAGTTNANGTPGWATKAGMPGMRSGCHYDRRPWVALDKEAPVRRERRVLRAYKITEAGFEAIAQYDARMAYEEEHLVLAKNLLKKFRKQARALKPK